MLGACGGGAGCCGCAGGGSAAWKSTFGETLRLRLLDLAGLLSRRGLDRCGACACATAAASSAHIITIITKIAVRLSTNAAMVRPQSLTGAIIKRRALTPGESPKLT